MGRGINDGGVTGGDVSGNFRNSFLRSNFSGDLRNNSLLRSNFSRDFRNNNLLRNHRNLLLLLFNSLSAYVNLHSVLLHHLRAVMMTTMMVMTVLNLVRALNSSIQLVLLSTTEQSVGIIKVQNQNNKDKYNHNKNRNGNNESNLPAVHGGVLTNGKAAAVHRITRLPNYSSREQHTSDKTSCFFLNANWKYPLAT